MTTLLLAGATGLVGQSVLRLALDDPRVARVVAPTRRALPGAPKLDNPLVDFEHLPADAPWWAVDAVVCTLGTTIRAAGSPQAFRVVDHDYPLAVARLARQHGAPTFVLTSARGADPASRILYNRIKGELERDLAGCGFASLTLVRPALIGGVRQASRPAERLGQVVVGALGPLLPRRWRINPADHIARALLDAAIGAAPGQRIVSSDALA